VGFDPINKGLPRQPITCMSPVMYSANISQSMFCGCPVSLFALVPAFAYGLTRAFQLADAQKGVHGLVTIGFYQYVMKIACSILKQG
jgi:hypothetical protein